MKVASEIHALIHSMSKAERRRFSLECDLDSKYSRLFHAIAKQEVYDEQALRFEFDGEPFTNNFAVAKSYLLEKILSVLRNRQEPISIEMGLRRTLDNLEILNQKGLIELADNLISQAMKDAQRFDLPVLELELWRWRRRLTALLPPKKRVATLAEMNQAEQFIIQKITDETRLKALRSEVLAIASEQIDLRQPENISRFEDLMKDPLLGERNSNLGFNSLLAYHQVHATKARLLGDAEQVQVHLKAALDAWEDAKHLQKAHPNQFLNALAGYLDGCLRANQFEDFKEKVDLIHSLSSNEPRLAAQAFYFGYHLEIRFAITTGELHPIIERIDVVEEGLKKHAKYLNEGIVVTFWYNITVLFFMDGDFQSALKHLNKILNAGKLSVRQDLADAARILEMAIHVELKNEVLLESLHRSMERRLRLNPRAHAYERIVCQGIRRLLDADPGQDRKVYEQMLSAMEELEGSSFTAGREEILIWIRHKLEGVPLREILMRG